MPKFIVTMKDPDGVSDSICDAADTACEHLRHEMTPREFDDHRERKGDAMFDLVKRWFKWTEVVRIEIDTDAGTATVLEVAS